MIATTKFQSKATQQFDSIDKAILHLLAVGSKNFDTIGRRLGLGGPEIASSVQRLLSAGIVSLGVVQYPWGVEFELRLVQNGTRRKLVRPF